MALCLVTDESYVRVDCRGCISVWFQGASPPQTVSCRPPPGLDDDVGGFHVSLANIFVAQVGTASVLLIVVGSP